MLELGEIIVRASLQGSVSVAERHPDIPKVERLAIRTWNTIAGLSMIGGIGYAFWGGWYWAAIGIVVSLAIAQANRKTAAEFVISAATSNADFKHEMVRRGIIIEN